MALHGSMSVVSSSLNHICSLYNIQKNKMVDYNEVKHNILDIYYKMLSEEDIMNSSNIVDIIYMIEHNMCNFSREELNNMLDFVCCR